MQCTRFAAAALMLGLMTMLSPTGAALAEEPASNGILAADNFSATLWLTTDYVFRGISQTDSKPAVQGSFDYAHPAGPYLGIWGSNVNSGISKGGIELDFYAGIARELLPNFNADAAILYYYLN